MSINTHKVMSMRLFKDAQNLSRPLKWDNHPSIVKLTFNNK